MKLLSRVLIILGVAWLIVIGMNWLREHHIIPVNENRAVSEQIIGPKQRDSSARFGGEHGTFGERSEHREPEEEALLGAVEMLGTLLKIGIITMIVTAINRVIRFGQCRSRRQPVPTG